MSIERRLPLLVGTLLLTVVLVLSGAAYEEVRRAARLIAAERLARATRELAEVFQRSAAQRITETRSLASDSSVRAYLASRTRRARARALAALQRVAAENALNAAVELRDGDGRVVLRSGAATLTPTPTPTPTAPLTDSIIVGTLRVLGDSILGYEVRAPITAGGGEAVQVRRIALSAQTQQTLRALTGGDITLLYGNAEGDPWTDFAGLIPAPGAEVRAAREPTEYHRGEAKLGAAAPVRGTPWLFVAELQRRQVYAPAQAYLVRMSLIATVIVLLGGLAAWWVSRRITTPLRRLTAGVEGIAAGAHSQRVPPGSRDELGRLAAAFNVMAERVEHARRGLEAEVAARTRELQHAKEQLERTSEERYRHLFHQSPLPMWVYDQETLAFLDVNEAAVRHYGWSREEFLAMTIKDIRPPEEVARLMAGLSDAPQGLYEAGVWRHWKKDGTIIHVEVTRHRLELPGRPVGLVLAHDITARLEAEEALRRLTGELEARVHERTAQLASSEERFRAVAETANDAIVSADHRGVITYFNPGAERIFGYVAGEVIGSALTILMPERLHDPHRAGFRRYLATGEARVVGRTVELVGRRKDGSEFPVELSLASWPAEGRPSFTGIIRDISDRKRTEAAQAEHARALARANTELEAANKQLESFSYSISHDLRAPLRAIDGFSRILLEDHAGELGAEPQRLLDVVRSNTQRMGQLIDDLLTFSRLGRREPVVAPVDMTALARDVATEARRAEGERAVELEIAELAPAHADEALIRQVWANLLSNALKFTRGRSPARIEIGSRPDGRETVYYVRDNGAGFDMRYADKLFGVFQRLHRHEDFEGTGVGLAIVQRVVQRHRGRVWAEGHPDRGATFFFSLPTEGEGAA